MAHSIHSILVSLDDLDGQTTEADVIESADCAIEGYRYSVYEYKYIPYGEDDLVLFGKNDPDKLIAELTRIKDYQLKEIGYYLKDKDVAALISKGVDLYESKESMPDTFFLKEVYDALQFLYGKYTSDSMYFDTEVYSSLVDIEKVAEHPEKYALVHIDLDF